jgi:hypothetical protein
MGNRGITDFAAKLLAICREGVTRELDAVVGNDPIGDAKMSNQSLEELDS